LVILLVQIQYHIWSLQVVVVLEKMVPAAVAAEVLEKV
jgi:hypothetical protein